MTRREPRGTWVGHLGRGIADVEYFLDQIDLLVVEGITDHTQVARRLRADCVRGWDAVNLWAATCIHPTAAPSLAWLRDELAEMLTHRPQPKSRDRIVSLQRAYRGEPGAIVADAAWELLEEQDQIDMLDVLRVVGDRLRPTTVFECFMGLGSGMAPLLDLWVMAGGDRLRLSYELVERHGVECIVGTRDESPARVSRRYHTEALPFS